MKVVYPGSFHPPTLGHMDVIQRASKLFDEVLVAVMMNPEKRYLFSAEDRMDMLRACSRDLPNVRVLADGGLLAELCKREGVDAILRGLRNDIDYGYEAPLAAANRALGGPETVYITAAPHLAHLSSTIAADVARHGGDLRGFVPEPIRERVARAFTAR